MEMMFSLIVLTFAQHIWVEAAMGKALGIKSNTDIMKRPTECSPNATPCIDRDKDIGRYKR